MRATSILAAILCISLPLAARPRRLVVIKADGLPGTVIQHWLHTTDPKTGRSPLPWIEHVFRERGAMVPNFYVRGISLSTSSWSMLDSGQHQVIRGNAEYDRLTLRVYDYLNFFPFYLNNARSRRVDMPAVEVLDQAGIPLFIDRYAPTDRYQAAQLLQRGVAWKTLQRSLHNRVTSRSIKQLFDEWQIGFRMIDSVSEQVERDILNRLRDDHTDYLDFFFTDFDHLTHLDNEESTQLDVLKKLDALVGRFSKAIAESPRAADTILVLVSDHGMNSDPKIISQGYNLIRLFNSAAGGGHHVITNRYPLQDYKLRGLDPFVSEVTSPSSESSYLAGEAGLYPTALLDLDGNERASISLRNSDLNRLQLHLRAALLGSAAARTDALALIETLRPSWKLILRELDQELAALARAIQRQRVIVASFPEKYRPDERALNLEDNHKRERAFLDQWERDESGYRSYADWLRRMLALTSQDLESQKLRLVSLIPPRTMGEHNTLHQLQNYAAGPAKPVDYFQLLSALRVRNNVQGAVADTPVDFTAARLDTRVFVYGDEEHQALLSAKQENGRLMIRYQPVAHLKQDAAGAVTFDVREWTSGFPLRIFEDPDADIAGDRAAWLSQWHSDEEWLRATHRTLYSNGVIGLLEYFAPIRLGSNGPLWRSAGPDATVLRRFEVRRRSMAQADLLIVASNHWNFNVRGFNPGGNHGSFFRISTNSTLLLSGAGVAPGLVVQTPYDSLSFVPTLLRLAGLATSVHPEGYPGEAIEELFTAPAGDKVR